MLLVVLAIVGCSVGIVISILLLVLSRNARTGTRAALRLGWAALLVAVASAAIWLAQTVVAHIADVNPMVPASIKIAAIVQLCEAYFVSTWVWLPIAFDRLEGTGATLMLAVRQLRARKSGFLTAISFLAFLGVGLSSCGLCGTISIMGGFGNDLKRKILGNNAHVVVDREDRQGFADWRPLLGQIRALPGVTSATPLVQGEVMVTSQTNLSGVILRGIDADTGGASSSLRRELIRGRFEYLDHPERLLRLTADERRPVTSHDPAEPPSAPLSTPPPPRPAPPPPPVPGNPVAVAPIPQPPLPSIDDSEPEDVLPGIIVGRELATNLHLAAGDEVRVVSPFGGMVTPAGPLPKTRLFRVAGIFYSGMYEYDTKYAYVTIPVAQDFFNYVGDRITSIEVRVNDVDRADEVGRAIGPRLRGTQLRERDWQQLNSNLFRALRLEKLMMFVLLGVAIMVASFAIVATLLLLVMEKGREIAVLKAMGASDAFIARVFVCVGLVIGVVGSLLGVTTALLVCSLILRYGIPLDPEVYYIDRLPVFISGSDYSFVMLIAVLICLAATLYPAWVAAKLRPVDGMRFG